MIFGVVIGVAAVLGAITAKVAAMRTRISMRAWVLFKIVPFLVPKYFSPGGSTVVQLIKTPAWPAIPAWYMRNESAQRSDTRADRSFSRRAARTAPIPRSHFPFYTVAVMCSTCRILTGA